MAPQQRQHDEVEALSLNTLHEALNAAISSEKNAELAMLYLFERYDFDPQALKSQLQAKGLDVSFSRVDFSSVAHFVGLDPDLSLRDAPTFQLHRARIPTALFKEIVQDIEVLMMQYGPPIDHANEEARSRFMAPMFNRLVALFKLRISNTPESTMPGRIATKGRIEYQFKVFGGLTIVFIEVKVRLGTLSERLDAIAQVIAESDACDFANNRGGFGSSIIHGILSDGCFFEFFTYDGSTKPATFSRGVFPTPLHTTTDGPSLIAFSTNPEGFIYSLRPVCETIFYFLLRGYQVGAHAHHKRSVERAQKEGRSGRESTPAWISSGHHADEALTLAVYAAGRAANGDIDSANKVVEEAMSALESSVTAAPPSYIPRDCNLMVWWDDKAAEAA